MFLGGTLFLCLDVTDLVRRMQIVLLDHPDQTVLQAKLDQANAELKRLVWTGEILFIFMARDPVLYHHLVGGRDFFF